MRKILVPIANFETGQAALELAAKLSGQFDADVTVLHTFTPPTRSLLGSSLASSKLDEWGIPSSQVRLLERAQQHLREIGLLKVGDDGAIAENHPPQAVKHGLYEIHNFGNVEQSVRFRVRDGKPVNQILLEAQDSRYDLIIMGTRGYTGLKRLLVGSIAQEVALHAPCSILVAKNLMPHQHILVGVTGRDTALEAVRQGAQMSLALGIKIRLVAIIPDAAMRPQAEANISAARQSIASQLQPEQIESSIVIGESGTTLLNEAGESHILVLGRAKRSRMSEIFLGDLSLKILNQSQGPVLISSYPRPLDEEELAQVSASTEPENG